MHQLHLPWFSLTSKYTENTLVLCLWPLKASGLPFVLCIGLQKGQMHFFSSFKTFNYVKRSLIHAFLPLKTSCVNGLLHFNLEKHHSYLAFSFFTNFDVIYCLILRLLIGKHIHCTLFAYLKRPKTSFLPFRKPFNI